MHLNKKAQLYPEFKFDIILACETFREWLIWSL